MSKKVKHKPPFGESALTKEDLDKMAAAGCRVPGCGCRNAELFIVPRCHPCGVEISYNPVDGLLHISCLHCQKPVADILPAPRQQWPAVRLDVGGINGPC